MFLSILLIVVGAAILLACFAWARSDEDDVARKILASAVQLMCLGVIVLGVMRLASARASSPEPTEDTSIAIGVSGSANGSRPVPRAGFTPTQLAAQEAARRAIVERDAEAARNREAQLHAAEIERLARGRAASAPSPISETSPSPTGGLPGTTNAGTEPPPAENASNAAPNELPVTVTPDPENVAPPGSSSTDVPN